MNTTKHVRCLSIAVFMWIVASSDLFTQTDLTFQHEQSVKGSTHAWKPIAESAGKLVFHTDFFRRLWAVNIDVGSWTLLGCNSSTAEVETKSVTRRTCLSSVASLINERLLARAILQNPIVHRDPFGALWLISNAGRDWRRIDEDYGGSSDAKNVLWFDASTSTVRRSLVSDSTVAYTIYTIDGRMLGTSDPEGVVHIGPGISSGAVLAVFDRSSDRQTQIVPIAR